MPTTPSINQSSISHDHTNNILFLNMKGMMTLNEYKEYFFNVLKTAKKLDCTSFIYDLSEFEYNSLQARTWKITVFLPQVFRELGADMIVGIVPPKNVMHRIGVEIAVKATNKMNYPYELSYFSDIERAKNWMYSKMK